MSRDYQTPLRRARFLGASKRGTTHFWHERLTALALLPLTAAFIFIAVKFVSVPYEEARQIMLSPWNAGALALFLLISIWHMKLGMQVIIEDYVHNEGFKYVLLISNLFFCVLLAFSALLALLRLSLGLS